MIARSACLICLFVLSGAAHCGGAQLALSAVVAKRAQVALDGRPAALVLTEADVARGYVEVSHGQALRIHSNADVRVEFSSTLPFARIELPALTLQAAPRGMTQRSIDLSYRILLEPAALPGTYAWPLQVLATPY